MERRFKVIYEMSEKDEPYDFEKTAAEIIANHFRRDIIFRRREILKTPDLIVGDQSWELKSPTGNGKNTIHNTFATSRKQSKNIIVDLRRCSMHEQKAFARIRDVYNKRRRKECGLLIINKRGQVLDISEIL